MSNYNYILKNLKQPAEDLAVLELSEPNGRPVFVFKPGQYVMISYRNKKGSIEDRHAFSIASSPTDSDVIRLGIRLGGRFTRGLLGLAVGDIVSVAGPFGDFVFDQQKHEELVMIAGGIGITPFLSAMHYAAFHNLPNRLWLFYSTRTMNGAAFHQEILELGQKNPNLKINFCITDEKVSEGQGVTNGMITGETIKQEVGPFERKSFFICGPAVFMNTIKNQLLALGARPSQIEMEEFSMIAQDKAWPMIRNFSYALGFSTVVFAATFLGITSANTVPSSGDKPDSNLIGLPRSDNEAGRSTQTEDGKTKTVAVPGKKIGPGEAANAAASVNGQIKSATASSTKDQAPVPTPRTAVS